MSVYYKCTRPDGTDFYTGLGAMIALRPHRDDELIEAVHRGAE